MEFREDVSLGMARRLSLPLMNGGGCCKTIEHVEELSRSIAGAIVVGSITVHPRDGNPGDVFWYDEESGAALNALGMPNPGERYLHTHLRDMVAIAHNAGKALVVNIAGANTSDYAILAATAMHHHADAIEINLGCPNVIGGDGTRKPIASFNRKVICDILSVINGMADEGKCFWVKVSPYSDPDQLKEVAELIAQFNFVKAVTAINTFPNAYAVNEHGKPRISVGLAGLSGAPLKCESLGQAKQWRDALPKRISVIGVGGIRTGRDIADFAAVGAEGFQMTTELVKRGRLDATPLEQVVTEYFDVDVAGPIQKAAAAR